MHSKNKGFKDTVPGLLNRSGLTNIKTGTNTPDVVTPLRSPEDRNHSKFINENQGTISKFREELDKIDEYANVPIDELSRWHSNINHDNLILPKDSINNKDHSVELRGSPLLKMIKEKCNDVD